MEQVMISNDERLITLTKNAYDKMNEQIQLLERERENNTIRLFTAKEHRYYRDEERWWDRVRIDVYFPDSIKSRVVEFVNECEGLKSEITESFKKLDLKVRDIEKREEHLKAQRLVPKWILNLCGVKLTK